MAQDSSASGDRHDMQVLDPPTTARFGAVGGPFADATITDADGRDA